MFIKSLSIHNADNVIRHIEFHKWINLIVDYTESTNQKESGNNIGKTTVLRLIDYCLGWDGKNIYSDPEFKWLWRNKIEDFVKENDIIITLILVERLDDPNSERITIKRNFLSRNRKIIELNGEKVNDGTLRIQLKELIFHSNTLKPTLREIIARNVRDENNKLIHTIKVLHSATTLESYETLYLFLLSIDVSDEKIRLQAQKKIEENLQTRLNKSWTLENTEQSLIILNRKINKLEEEKKRIWINDNFKKDIDLLNQIKGNINLTSSEIGSCEMRISLIGETQEELEKEHSNIDTYSIQTLYEKVKAFIPNIQVAFEDLNTFHNTMLKERLAFITEDLPLLKKNILSLDTQLQKLLEQEFILSEKLQKAGVLENNESIVYELTKLYEQKGSFEKQKEMWVESNEKVTEIDEEIGKINTDIKNKDTVIKERISKFNEFFSEISSKLYGEEFILSSAQNDRTLELNITNLVGNLWTWKKKWQIIAFDLAYIQFCDALNIRCLHFTLHDQIENIHGNQIYSVLTNVVNGVNCQYIAPVLHDKLPKELDISRYEVLKLSEKDKLFKIE